MAAQYEQSHKPTDFPVKSKIRYKPGEGTYGYEEDLRFSPDGRVPGEVVGHTPKRVRVRLQVSNGRLLTRSVDPDQLILAPPEPAP